MKKFDKLKYWLDLNEYIKTSLALWGLAIAILGITSLIESGAIKNISILILIFISILSIMQLILGIRQIGIDNKAKQVYLLKYQKQLDNLKKATSHQ